MYLADFHIHSKYSRATSKDCDLPHLDLWARRKGIQLLGTGDFTHPAWRKEMQEQLIPDGNGFYQLRPDLVLSDAGLANSVSPRFVVTGEISSIYKKNGRVRKVHNVILLPGLEEAEILSKKLEAIGNIHSDGRPILGLDCKDLLEITLDSCQESVFIPAHIWTPHFSLFGAFSGFDMIEECFEDLTPHIHALETGLSSDPPMNWRVSALDRFFLVSNSDAHSPAKLGREANLLDTELSYHGFSQALCTGKGLLGTIEFFPEEGKYHLDGHRNCHICLTPEETERLEGKCPVCGKKLTIGVQHRVEELADRPVGFHPENAKTFESLAPLPEVIAGSLGYSATGAKNQELYSFLLNKLGPEFYILREAPLEDIRREGGPCLEEGIRRLREGRVERIPGYDGEYGIISLLSDSERESLNGQISLFGVSGPSSAKKTTNKKAVSFRHSTKDTPSDSVPVTENLNAEQIAAVSSTERAVAVLAGPGTGKTRTLVAKIAYLVEKLGVSPSEITAVTFTNQAAAEMRQRLEARLGGKRSVRSMTIGTFHAICFQILGRPSLLSETDALEIASQVLHDLDMKESPKKFLEEVSKIKNGAASQISNAYQEYCRRLASLHLLDFDDLLKNALETSNPPKRCFSYLLVDEFQDINQLQYELILQWQKNGKHLFAIGDPDQSIYGFRGANSQCFERLQTDFPTLRTIRLHQNYRSSPQILSCALHTISHNPGADRNLTAYLPDGHPVRVIHAETDFSEAIAIAKEISRMAGGVDMLDSDFLHNCSENLRSFSDIAVLCRTHRQLDLIEKCLRHDSIPCLVFGKEDFLQDPIVHGTIAFFQWLLDPQDALSLQTCLKLVWNCPADLIEWAKTSSLLTEGISEQFLEEAEEYPILTPWISAVKEYHPVISKEKPHKTFARWNTQYPASESLKKLENSSVFYSHMQDFLQAILLGQEQDLCRISGKNYSSGAVRLMTLHGAKGLEFPVVFLAGVKQGMLPLESPRHPTDTEEERRLFFVGITRAQEELILSSAQASSPFLAELPLQSIKEETASSRTQPDVAEQLSLF